MRLIDADDLMYKLTELEITNPNFVMAEVKGLLVNAPTIEEHKHGHWIQVSDWDKDANAHFDCSVCGFGDKHGDDVVVPYCWHCGAVMDEEAENK